MSDVRSAVECGRMGTRVHRAQIYAPPPSLLSLDLALIFLARANSLNRTSYDRTFCDHATEVGRNSRVPSAGIRVVCIRKLV